MLEIGELTKDRFRGIFKLSYSEDAHVVLQTKVQVNPVSNRQPRLSFEKYSNVLAADTPLVMPLRLTLSKLKLRGIATLVVCRNKGVTLVFKNDPLESIQVSSSFDGFPVVERFLQREIEKQLRMLFQEDLPALVHRTSMRYLEKSKVCQMSIPSTPQLTTTTMGKGQKRWSDAEPTMLMWRRPLLPRGETGDLGLKKLTNSTKEWEGILHAALLTHKTPSSSIDMVIKVESNPGNNGKKRISRKSTGVSTTPVHLHSAAVLVEEEEVFDLAHVISKLNALKEHNSTLSPYTRAIAGKVLTRTMLPIFPLSATSTMAAPAPPVRTIKRRVIGRICI